MSLRRKIFIAFVLILALAGAGMTYWVQTEARNSYAHVVEEILADLAQLFAAQIQQEIANGASESIKSVNWEQSFGEFKKRKFSAEILNVIKTQTAIDAYITDAQGIVLYSSRDKNEIGKDYSQWRDVALSLRGKYGARASRSDKEDKQTSVYYVAAPIYSGEKIIGVVSVIKARTSVTTVLDYFFQKMVLGVSLVIILALVFGGLLFVWITAPIDSLRNYALEISKGHKIPLPEMPHRELKQLGNAFEEMRISLEGRKTIEKFIQSLIHELKSPLAAVRGSAELMLEPMADQQRDRFLKNILEETGRAQDVLQQILTIAALESQASLAKTESVNLNEIMSEAQEALISICAQSKVSFKKINAPNPIIINGDKFLLTQALRNILQNAIEFSDAEGSVQIETINEGTHVKLKFIDDGSGIPSYAQNRLFEKFFSLERPRTGKKGTGLGLSFVREVILLHKGTISIVSPISGRDKGTLVEIILPV